MTSDVRSLLRAAANERSKAGASGISDPFASYSAMGGLRCSACNHLAIKHETLWSAHVLSKIHRVNIARIRDEELRQAEVQRIKDGKRKADDTRAESEKDGSMPADTDDCVIDGSVAPGSKKARTDSNETGYHSPSIDPEWELFKSQMDETGPDTTPPTEGYSDGAALEAEAQLISRGGDSQSDNYAENEVGQKSVEELEAEERLRKEQEEREEIFSRMEEEQRQQDEADQRVNALKQRLQRIKQARLKKQKPNKKP